MKTEIKSRQAVIVTLDGYAMDLAHQTVEAIKIVEVCTDERIEFGRKISDSFESVSYQIGDRFFGNEFIVSEKTA